MAGDWIKWEHGLHLKPEVVRMAGLLEMPRDSVVVRLMVFWEWCDRTIAADAVDSDGHAVVTNLSPRDGDNRMTVDDVVTVKGFAAALESVGWITFRDGVVVLNNWGRHNGETAKTRARNYKAQQAKRRRDRGETRAPQGETPTNGHQSVTNLSPRDGDELVTGKRQRQREEKRGSSAVAEDPLPPVAETATTPPQGGSLLPDHDGGSPGPRKRKPRSGASAAEDVPVPGALRTEEFLETWARWLQDRRQRRKPVTPIAAEQQLGKLARLGPAQAVATILRSIENGWSGLFPESNGRAASGPHAGDYLGGLRAFVGEDAG